jgi:hypothetical protein
LYRSSAIAFLPLAVPHTERFSERDRHDLFSQFTELDCHLPIVARFDQIMAGGCDHRSDNRPRIHCGVLRRQFTKIRNSGRSHGGSGNRSGRGLRRYRGLWRGGGL